MKVSLAGIHYPDISFLFGATGVFDASEDPARRGWRFDSAIYMAEHFRAAEDMLYANPQLLLTNRQSARGQFSTRANSRRLRQTIGVNVN